MQPLGHAHEHFSARQIRRGREGRGWDGVASRTRGFDPRVDGAVQFGDRFSLGFAKSGRAREIRGNRYKPLILVAPEQMLRISPVARAAPPRLRS